MRPTLTALEDALHADPHGKARAAMLADLYQALQHLNQRLRQPLLRDEYASLLRCQLACQAAITVIDTLWARSQSPPEIR